MLKLGKIGAVALLASTALFGLTACEKQGPAETAGKEIDEAAQQVEQAMEDAAKKVDEAIDE